MIILDKQKVQHNIFTHLCYTESKCVKNTSLLCTTAQIYWDIILSAEQFSVLDSALRPQDKRLFRCLCNNFRIQVLWNHADYINEIYFFVNSLSPSRSTKKLSRNIWCLRGNIRSASFFHSGSQTKIFMHCRLSHLCYMDSPSHCHWFNHVNNI
jgi:hypothetical protein